MSKGKFFKELALSFYGCDGGNLQSKIWFCGLEWGGDLVWEENTDSEKIVTIDEDYGYLDDQYREVDYCNNVSWSHGFGGGLANGFNQKICWFLNYYLGLDPTDSYQYDDFVREHKICFNEPDGIGFKMNLFPLNSPGHNHDWDENRARFSGFFARRAYEEWCEVHRGEFFQRLVRENGPEVIIATGKTSWSKFVRFFGAEAIPLQEASLNEVTISYCKLPYSDTYLIITPFFGGPSGINSFKKMQDLATLVHQVRGTEVIDWF